MDNKIVLGVTAFSFFVSMCSVSMGADPSVSVPSGLQSVTVMEEQVLGDVQREELRGIGMELIRKEDLSSSGNVPPVNKAVVKKPSAGGSSTGGNETEEFFGQLQNFLEVERYV